MANIVDTVKQAIAKAAGSGIRTISNINPTVGGKIGSVVDYIGNLLGNPLPETGATEYAQSKGGYEMMKKNPVEAEIKTFAKTGRFSSSNLGREFTRQVSQQRSGQTVGVQTSPVLQSKTFTPAELAGMSGLPESEMWEGKEVVIGGQKYVVRDDKKGGRYLEPISSGGGGGGGDSRPSPEQIVNEVLDRAKGSGTGNLYDEDTIRKIIDDVYNKGMSVADAMEARGKEAAEQRWRLINENLQRQKGEIKTEAERQRQLAREQETLYKGQIEKRKGEELEAITKQKEASEKEVMQMKDDLGRAFVDSSRKLQAVLRASGVSKSGFAIAQETELLRNFNRNLDAIAVRHKDLVDELDKAYRDTISVYNDKIDNLEFETRKMISDISTWERQQIVAIQNNENLNLADKLDRINDAINRADAVRMQVEQNYANQKLAWAQWAYKMQVKMALSAQAAAQGRVDNAYKNLQLIRQNYQDAINNVAFAKWQQTPTGEWSLMSPTYAGYIPIGTYSDEEKRRIEQKKMEQQVSPLSQWLSGLELGSGGSW